MVATIVAEGKNGEKYRMNGPYWIGMSSIDEPMGGVFIILESPKVNKFDFVYAGESHDLEDALFSRASKKKWRKLAGKHTYAAYLHTDAETESMSMDEAKEYRRNIAESITVKYESEMVRKDTIKRNNNTSAGA